MTTEINAAQTPGQLRTAKARAVRQANVQAKLADILRAKGWTCIPPAGSTK